MNNEEEYLSCRFLQQGLIFNTYQISCCNLFHQGLIFYKYNEKIDNLDFDKIRTIRQSILEAKSIPENCKGCLNLEKKIWNNNGKIKYIELDHWQNCNIKCVYCSNKNEDGVVFLTDEINKAPHYKVLPLIKKIIENDMLDENFQFNTTGGEPAVLDEFEDILTLLVNKNFELISLLSSGYTFVPAIADALKKKNVFLTISLDSGTSETCAKIKRRDAFEKIIENIKKYLKNAYDPQQIIIKFLLFIGFNDNKQEIDKFFDKMVEIGVKNITFSMEFCHAVRSQHHKKIPKQYYELIEYARQKSLELNINFSLIPFVQDLLEKGHY